MNARTEERVDGWTSRPFTGGYDGLRKLADEEFSGVVETDAGPWACLLNGKVIGVFEGRIEGFEDAAGTTYVAPDPAVPLLFAMQERGGSLEEQYYTKDTPISEADRTLSSGSFVGYIELSENVLSGNYYVCYYGGRSMPVAFVGNSDQLVTGDEAFRKADDEVGIYDVYSVDMEVVEVPGEAAAVGTADAGGDAVAEDATGEPAETNGAGTDAGYGDRTDDWGSRTDDAEHGTGAETDDPDEEYAVGADEGSGTGIDDEYGAASDDPGYGTDAGGGSNADPAEGDGAARGDAGNAGVEGSGSREVGPDESDVDEIRYGDDDATDETGIGFDRSGSSTDSPGREGTDPAGDRRAEGPAPGGSHGGADRRADDRTGDPVGSDRGVDRAALETVRERVRYHEETIETLKSQLSVAKREHEQFEDEHDRLEGEHDRLEESAERLRESVGNLESDLQDLYRRVDRMESRLDAVDRIERRLDELADGNGPAADPGTATPADSGTTAPADSGTATPADSGTTAPADSGTTAPADHGDEAGEDSTPPGPSDAADDAAPAGGGDLSAGEALRETNLLVRYDSKGRPTLESVHAEDADRAAVNDNLRLDTHTSFAEEETTVEGRPFEEFLTDRLEYEFAEWLVRDLPYEIRDTGNANALGDLYDALPEIDRIEMYADIEIIDEAEETTETVVFDVVVRDKSGRPLVVANFNDSRDPATKEMIVDLEESARALRSASDLRAALLVTRSYFDPEALETVEQVTGGSLLSRDSKKSYVKLSRKRGYHLCLVESRDGDFHLNVPEL